MSRKIIGISGFIGTGKNTVADIILEHYDFKRISYADRLKDTLSTMFGWSRDMLEGKDPESRAWREQPDAWWSQEFGYDFTPRLAMQRVGTDCMRQGLDNDIWVKFVKFEITSNPNTNYVIPDVRFFNERNLIRDLGGEWWQVRKGPDPDWASKAISDNRYDTDWMTEHPEIHESEWRWMDYNTEFDRIISNDGTYTELCAHVLRAINY